jgi:hypothetical protein
VGPARDLAAGFGILRRFVYFALGVAVIVDAVVASGSNVAEYVTGLILLGLIPLDAAATARVRGPDRRRRPPPADSEGGEAD